VPGRKILRMIANVLIDMGLGAIPVVGDLFDAFYHQNTGNMRILLEHRRKDIPPRAWKEIAAIAILVFLLLLSVSVAVTLAVIVMIVWIVSLISGLSA